MSIVNASPKQKETSQKNFYLYIIPSLSTLKSESLTASNTPKKQLALVDNKGTEPKVIDFNKMKPQSSFRRIKEQYLTYYTGKNKKLNLAYTDGAYGFSYTQNW